MSLFKTESLHLPEVIDLRILGRCDLRCPFCFGPRHELKAAPTSLLLEQIRRFPSLGVRSIIITGGEPTLVADLPEILTVAKAVGLKTVLSSNGIILRRRLHSIAPFLDWLGLPLDGPTALINDLLRVGKHSQFEAVMALIPQIRSEYPTVGIKLGTVATKRNLSDIPDIARNLPTSHFPDVWKIYQVAYSGYAKDNMASLGITDEEYQELTEVVSLIAAERGINLLTYTRKTREAAYLFMEPNGDAKVIVDGDEFPIGNFFTEFEKVVETWPQFISESRLRGNFERTYYDRG